MYSHMVVTGRKSHIVVYKDTVNWDIEVGHLGV